KAFQVNDLKDLCSADNSGTANVPVGLLSCSWGKQAPFAPPDESTVAAHRTLVVDPSITSSGDGRYKNLNGAVADIKPDEEVEILLRFSGAQSMSPVLIDKRVKVTIRPYRDFHPIVLVDKTRDKNSYLFRVLEGEVSLEGFENSPLEFRLEP